MHIDLAAWAMQMSKSWSMNTTIASDIQNHAANNCMSNELTQHTKIIQRMLTFATKILALGLAIYLF
jgi:hypothetical protein